MIGRPERFGVAMPEPGERAQHPRGQPVQLGAQRVAARLVDVEAGQHGGQRRDRRRARVQVRRRGDLEQLLDLGRAGDEGQQRRVGLGEAADQHEVVVALAGVADDAVAAHPVRRGLPEMLLADHAEAVGVVDVEQGAVAARDLGEGGEVRRVARHRVHAVHADEARAVGLLAHQLVEVVGVLEAEPAHGGAARLGHLAAVVDRLVGAGVEEDRARGGQQRDHRHVDVGDGREDQRVLAAQQRGQLRLDLLVEDRAAEQARPARVRPPGVEVGRDGVDDLAVEVEAEVVAGGEVGQPVVADADHAAVDLVDDGVHHRMRRGERRQVGDGGEPVLEPGLAAGRAGLGARGGDGCGCCVPCRALSVDGRGS